MKISLIFVNVRHNLLTFVKTRQNSSKFVKKKFVKSRRKFVKIRHEIGFQSDAFQNLQQKNDEILQNSEFLVVRRNAYFVGFEKMLKNAPTLAI